MVRLRLARSSGCHVHRKPQSRGIQRDQVLPGGRQADHLGQPRRSLSQLVARFDRYAASGEINSRVDDQQMIVDRVAAAFAGRGEQDRIDGLTISGPDWWVNVRPSNTEPLLRLNVEAANAETMEALRDETLGLIRA